MVIRVLRLLWVVGVCMMLGCQSKPVSVDVERSFLDTTWQGGRTYQVLVVGYALDSEIRVEFEDRLTDALLNAGVEALASYEVYPSLDRLNVASMQRYLAVEPERALLISKALSVQHNRYRENIEKRSSFIQLADEHAEWSVVTEVQLETLLFVGDQDLAVWDYLSLMQMEAGESSVALKRYISDIMQAMTQNGVVELLN